MPLLPPGKPKSHQPTPPPPQPKKLLLKRGRKKERKKKQQPKKKEELEREALLMNNNNDDGAAKRMESDDDDDDSNKKEDSNTSNSINIYDEFEEFENRLNAELQDLEQFGVRTPMKMTPTRSVTPTKAKDVKRKTPSPTKSSNNGTPLSFGQQMRTPPKTPRRQRRRRSPESSETEPSNHQVTELPSNRSSSRASSASSIRSQSPSAIIGESSRNGLPSSLFSNAANNNSAANMQSQGSHTTDISSATTVRVANRSLSPKVTPERSTMTISPDVKLLASPNRVSVPRGRNSPPSIGGPSCLFPPPPPPPLPPLSSTKDDDDTAANNNNDISSKDPEGILHSTGRSPKHFSSATVQAAIYARLKSQEEYEMQKTRMETLLSKRNNKKTNKKKMKGMIKQDEGMLERQQLQEEHVSRQDLLQPKDEDEDRPQTHQLSLPRGDSQQFSRQLEHQDHPEQTSAMHESPAPKGILKRSPKHSPSQQQRQQQPQQQQPQSLPKVHPPLQQLQQQPKHQPLQQTHNLRQPQQEEYEILIHPSSVEGTTAAAAWHLHGQTGGRQPAKMPHDTNHGWYDGNCAVMNTHAVINAPNTSNNATSTAATSPEEENGNMTNDMTGRSEDEFTENDEFEKVWNDASSTSSSHVGDTMPSHVTLGMEEGIPTLSATSRLPTPSNNANNDPWSTGIAAAIVTGTAARYHKSFFLFPHGRRVLLPIVMGMLATALSLVTIVSCQFMTVSPKHHADNNGIDAIIAEEEIHHTSTTNPVVFQLGPWRYLSINPTYSDGEVCLPYPSDMTFDTAFLAARSTSALASCFGAMLVLWACTLLCVPVSKGSMNALGLCFALTGILQCLTTTLYQSRNCKSAGGYFGSGSCTPNQDLVFCTAAAILYFATGWILYVSNRFASAAVLPLATAGRGGGSNRAKGGGGEDSRGRMEVYTWSSEATSSDPSMGVLRTVEKCWTKIPNGSTLMATVFVERRMEDKGAGGNPGGKVKTTYSIQTELLPV